MSDWRRLLRIDPIPHLEASGSEPITYFTRRDLLKESPGPVEALWSQRHASKLLSRQRPDGSWRYPGSRSGEKFGQDYDQLETYRNLTQLVELYGANVGHPKIRLATEYLFGKQTREGDFRGIYGAQYTPNYSAAITETLIKAGLGGDMRIESSLCWLTSARQSGGGWAIPMRTAGHRILEALRLKQPVAGNRDRPPSHMVTGVVLRAFAADERHRRDTVALDAGVLLRDSLFQRDAYPDRATREYWTRFTYPFWFTDLLSAMDTLSRIGFGLDDEEISAGMSWFNEKQTGDGGWRLSMLKGKSIPNLEEWVSLAICRVFARLHERAN